MRYNTTMKERKVYQFIGATYATTSALNFAAAHMQNIVAELASNPLIKELAHTQSKSLTGLAVTSASIGLGAVAMAIRAQRKGT